MGPSTARSPNKKAMTDDKAAAESKIHPELQSLMKVRLPPQRSSLNAFDS